MLLLLPHVYGFSQSLTLSLSLSLYLSFFLSPSLSQLLSILLLPLSSFFFYLIPSCLSFLRLTLITSPLASNLITHSVSLPTDRSLSFSSSLFSSHFFSLSFSREHQPSIDLSCSRTDIEKEPVRPLPHKQTNFSNHICRV